MTMTLTSLRNTAWSLDKQKTQLSDQLRWTLTPQLKKSLGELQCICDALAKMQASDDRDVQAIHRDLGELAGADDQNRVGALLGGLENEDGASSTHVLPGGFTMNAVAKSMYDLRALVEAIRVGNKRVDVVRLKAYAASALAAVERQDWDAAKRFGEHIVIELASGLRS